MGRIGRITGKTPVHRLGTRGAGRPGRASTLRSEATRDALASEEVVVAAPVKKKKKASKKTTKKS
tara:strand:+ start:858 stop:1052 length:195 start_codon:yes stop_codon:yes gene_type:complete